MSSDPPVLYCANHPTVETSLRCNRCEKPICTKCAVLTPTGYRCKECVRGQQKVFNTAEWYDYVIAVVVAGGLAYLGSLIVPLIGFFTIFLAPVAAIAIAEIIRLAIRKHRAKLLFQLSAAAAVAGCLPMLIRYGLSMFAGFGYLGFIWMALYTVTLASTIYYRLRGISIK